MDQEKENLIFYNFDTAENYPVTKISKLDPSILVEGGYYIYGDYVYKYIGTIHRMSDIPGGCIYKKDRQLHLNKHKGDEEKEKYSLTLNVFNASKGRELPTMDVDKLVSAYVKSYENEENIMATDKDILVNAGNIFIPPLKDTDDPLTFLIKSVLNQKKVNLADYKGSYDKPHVLNNMRSALIGTTKTTSIKYFLEWCKLLELKWRIKVWDDGTDSLYPLLEDIIISTDLPLVEDKNLDIPIGALYVPIDSKDDPLKRVIKIALTKKKPIMKRYKDKCPSDFTISNMISSLKSDTKMTITYFRSWCDILGMHWSIGIEDTDGEIIEINTVD